MEIGKLFGLPAHPLLVHAPIVLLPLASVGAIAMLLPSWRRRIGWIVVALAGISVVAIQLSIESGYPLEEGTESGTSHELINRHADLAEQLRPIAALFFLVLLGFMVFEWWKTRQLSADGVADPTSQVARMPASRALYAGTAVLALLAAVWVVRVGHSGADATWHDVQVSTGGDEGHEGGEGDELRPGSENEQREGSEPGEGG